MLERPRVQALWVSTVTRAHRQLIDVLEDDTGPVSTEEGVVVLDLQPLMIQLGERVAIIGDVAERFGPDAGRIEIMQADQLETAQNLTQGLKFLGSWLWVLPIALFGDRAVDRPRAPALDPATDRLRIDPRWFPRARRAPACRQLRRRRSGAVGDRAARRAGCLGHPHRTAPRRRLHPRRTRRDRARGSLAGRYLAERGRRQEGARPVPRPPGDRVRRSGLPVPAAALVAADGPDEPRAADARGRGRPRRRGRALATPDGARGAVTGCSGPGRLVEADRRASPERPSGAGTAWRSWSAWPACTTRAR